VKRRNEVALTPDEQAAFLESSRTATLCSIDRQGYPHAVAMWYCVIDGKVHMTSFRKAQKVVNLRREPKVALLVESGARYSELRGLMIRGRAEIIDDPELALDVLMRVQARHGGSSDPAMREALRGQAAKRSVIRVHPERVASWDHAKLGGAY
jgi:PPOX class probable F420-dependent enzyme